MCIYKIKIEIEIGGKERERKKKENKTLGGFKRISSLADDGGSLNRVDCKIQFWDWNRHYGVLFLKICDRFFEKK